MEDSAFLHSGAVTSTMTVWMAVMSKTALPEHPLPASRPTLPVITTYVSRGTGSVTPTMIVAMDPMKRTVVSFELLC
jgi:hypothetical protein